MSLIHNIGRFGKLKQFAKISYIMEQREYLPTAQKQKEKINT
jgi:hypothetical protein